MKKTHLVIFGLLLIAVLAAYGVVPQKWELKTFGEFLQGKFEGISVTYDGVLSFSPNEEKYEGPPEEFYLSLLVDSEGASFLGTGHGGKIYKIAKDGQFELYFQMPEMDIYCLAQDGRGNLFAGTSPNGAIWKISEKGKGEVFFNPQERYIWDLEFSDKGNLLAAVGENGGIYEINPKGEGSPILQAKENHILCIEWTENGDLIAGSGGNGLLYRIAEGGKTSVIYESPFEEIKSLAFDDTGNIYIACGGKVVQPQVEKEGDLAASPATDVTITVSAEAPAQGSGSLSSSSPFSGEDQPGALLRVDPGGMAKLLWQSSDELIYTIFWDSPNKQVVFGTGKKGRIYSIDANEDVSLLMQKDSEQIYLLVPLQRRIYTLANNPPSFSLLQPEQRFDGVYTSRIFDTKNLSSWGKMEWLAEVPEGSSLQIQTRSGNSKDPNHTWSDWSPPYSHIQGEQILSPKARYIQFKALFKALSGRSTPQLKSISLFYLQTNVAPVISRVDLLPSNEVFLKPLDQEETIWGHDPDLADVAKINDKAKGYVMAKRVTRKGFQTIQWEAVDENGDSLLYSVFIRGENENKWRLLKEGWPEKLYAFDTLSLPDGNYYIKIEAVDSPSNPDGMELKSEKISRQLVIDNSLPVIKNLEVVRNRNSLTLNFTAEDAFSQIKEVQYLIRPNEWKTVFPEDGICDSKIENFIVSLSLPPNADDLVTIKVRDSRDNIGVARKSY